jgi:hypothetical protein
MLILVAGLPGVGKTTVAKNIAKKLNASFVDTDVIKHKLLPKLIGKDEWKKFIEEQKSYPLSVRKRIYEKMCIEVEKLLKLNKDVVVEATFATKSLREIILNLASRLDVKYYIVKVICPENIVKKRMEERHKKTKHPARYGIHLEIKKIWEPIDEEHFVINTNKNIENQTSKFIDSLG